MALLTACATLLVPTLGYFPIPVVYSLFGLLAALGVALVFVCFRWKRRLIGGILLVLLMVAGYLIFERVPPPVTWKQITGTKLHEDLKEGKRFDGPLLQIQKEIEQRVFPGSPSYSDTFIAPWRIDEGQPQKTTFVTTVHTPNRLPTKLTAKPDDTGSEVSDKLAMTAFLFEKNDDGWAIVSKLGFDGINHELTIDYKPLWANEYYLAVFLFPKDAATAQRFAKGDFNVLVTTK